MNDGMQEVKIVVVDEEGRGTRGPDEEDGQS